MRILVLGAGGIGGYFGGRLLEAGRDVTFLVRPRRAEALAASGLEIRSRHGDVTIPSPPTVLAGAIPLPFDLILVACKAYDLDSAMDALAPAVGPQTVILPLLNGMSHLERLDERFGAERVLGGFCLISVALQSGGRIVHFNKVDALVFGERGEEPARAPSRRTEAIAAEMDGAKFQPRLSPVIVQEMWEKWIFIAAGAGITCLMRASLGDIVAAGGSEVALAMLDDCAAIAAANGHAPRAEKLAEYRAALSRAGSPLMASMLRDVERHAPVEAGHILGDLLHRGERFAVPAPTLRMAYLHLKAYEARRQRDAVAARQG
jgi:2-dehydropantoate 2-reductase